MLLGFQRRFASKIRRGLKTHTIRARRKIAPRVGETCHSYVDPRRSTMKLLGRWPCVKVETITIAANHPWGKHGYSIWIDGNVLSDDEMEGLARRDGFRDFREMLQFWEGRLPFEGDVIHWSRS